MIDRSVVVASPGPDRENHMSNMSEIPQLAGELVELSKEYLRQETLEPAKRLGKVAGMSVGAGILVAIGVILLATAGMRLLIEVFREGGLWTALALVSSALVSAGVAGLIVWRATR